LATPLQARPAPPVASQVGDLAAETTLAAETPPDDGQGWLWAEAVALVLASVAAAWAGGTRRGRGLLKRLWRRRPRLSGRVGGSTGGALGALGRLAMGLRLWIVDRGS
jgi:hypothetical protein